MGRKALPTNLKLLKGTMRTGRLNLDEPTPDVEVPEPPAFLATEALEEWCRITPLLVKLGIISQIDRTALAAYCQTYGRWAQAEAAIIKAGLLSKTINGNIIQSPLLGIANRAMEIMRSYLAEFGMTPASRYKISTGIGREREHGRIGKWA